MMDRPRILCLDDESSVLDGLRRTLHSSYDVVTTTEPREALALLAEKPDDPFAVIISDMRMPSMTGINVLEQAQQLAPDTTRVLLTGDADVQGAIGAINRGNVFRFILKPCPPEPLMSAIAAADQQHRLVRAERELLQDTLKGCVDALMDTLAMAQPALFSRAGRLRRIVQDVCAQLGMPDAWQVEMAAQLGEIGAITLPPTALDALQNGTPADAAEAEMLEALPRLADSVLARIPRLDAVREIIRQQLPTDRNPITPMRPDASAGARLLQAVREYDVLVHRGTDPNVAIRMLTFRKVHTPVVVAALANVADLRQTSETVREVTIDELLIGHELADDLHTAKGLLLVSRGQVITERLLVRVRNFHESMGLQGRILVTDEIHVDP
ncbi:response regulator [Amorphoplanes digitatis]|uniref:response regulator n=1 Tax=Actinoplanes digitatis TaxID=1868 RepID=UPI0016205AD0|nr:HD domain-containing phosphohydrolase [Actinoplanes digitatis]